MKIRNLVVQTRGAPHRLPAGAGPAVIMMID
jgi:hypothetical protein